MNDMKNETPAESELWQENEAVQGQHVTGNIYRGSDGAYRWIYRMELWRNSWQFWMAAKVFGVCMGIFPVLSVVVSLAQGTFDIWALLAPMCVCLVMAVIFLISWGIYLAISGGEYWAMFVMDERGVTHMQMDRSYKQARMLNLLAAALANSPGAKAGALGRSLVSSWHSDFAGVKSVVIDRKHDMIGVNGMFMRNAVFTAPEDYEFVLGHIMSKVPQGTKTVEKK